MDEQRSIDQGDAARSDDRPPKCCDHTSVGILIYDDHGRLLLIDRGTFPFGLAPPAGHVDAHPSYEAAAVAEAFEEVGLSIAGLELVTEGRRDNPCRRVDGSWHYWKVFRTHADSAADLRLSEREVRSAKWYTPQELAELGLDEPEEKASPVEHVWRAWLGRAFDDTDRV